MYFWIVFYDQNGNELQRTAEKYGSTPIFKGNLPEGFIKWKYKKTGKDVTTFLPIVTNTYFIAEQTISSKPVKTPTYHIEYLDEAGFIFSGEHENGYPTIHTYGKDTILKSAFKYGYEFEGWYEDYECDRDPITVLKAKDYTDDIFLYAKWKQITTTVNCYVYDNTASTEKEYVPLKNVKIMYDVENGGTYFGTTSEYGFAQLEVPSYKKGYFKVSKPGYETIVLDPVTYGNKQIANEYFWMDRSVATISLISKHGHFKGITTAQDNVDSINVYVGQYFSANCNGYIYVADDKLGTNVKVYQFVADEGYAFSSFNPTIPYTKVYKSFNIIAKTNKLETVTFYAGTPDEMYKGAAITSINGDWNFTEGRKVVECTFVASTKDKDIIKNFNKNCETNYNGYELKEWTRKTGTNDFYPTWIAKEYEVTFISGVESLGNQKVNETYDSKYILPAKSPIKTGYEFVGWFTSEEGGTQVTTETIVKITEPTSLYAHYSPITYQTIFKGNYEGSTYEITLDETYDSKFVLPEVNPTRDGYMFAGWYTKAEGGNLITNETIVDASIRKAYAHWTDAIVYMYVYNKDGDYLEDATVSFKAEGEIKGSTTTDGYGFASINVPYNKQITWTITKDGYKPISENKTYNNFANDQYFWMEEEDIVITLEGNGLFYDQWEYIPRTPITSLIVEKGQYIWVNENGWFYIGESATDQNPHAYNFEQAEGYRFTSFETYTSTPTEITESITLTAKTEEIYNIIVEDDGHGTASANLTSTVPGATVTLTATPNEGYIFKQWQIIRGLESITDNSFTMPSNEVKIKAIFEKIVAIVENSSKDRTAYASLEAAVNAASNEDTIYLTASEIECGRLETGNKSLTFMPEGKSVTITLTGSLLFGDVDGNKEFTISGNGNYTLTIKPKLKDGANEFRPITIRQSNTLNMEDNVILTGSNFAIGAGGMLSIGKYATFNMTGGTFKDCNVTTDNYDNANSQLGRGGAIYVLPNANFNMTGGRIENCHATVAGGAVFVVGNFNMFGGKIINCSVTGLADPNDEDKVKAKGGAVYLFGGSGFDMTAGEISGNTLNNVADMRGAGVYAAGGASITLGGTANIKENTNGDGKSSNLFLYNNQIVTISDVNEPKNGMKIGVSTQTDPSLNDPIIITYCNKDYSGFFVPDNADYMTKFNTYYLELAIEPPTFSIVKDILPEGFPSGEAAEEDMMVEAPTGAWKTSEGTYAAAIINYQYTDDELEFINVDNVYDHYGLPLNTSLIKVDDSTYTAIQPNVEDFELTFTLQDYELIKINFAAKESTWDHFNGDYSSQSQCIAAGTMISLPEGKQKAVEELEVGDVICTFDHETGKASSAPVAFIWESKNVGNAFILTFENDVEVTVIDEHGFYDQEEQKYVFINLQNAQEYIGDHFYDADTDSWLALKSCEALNDSVDAYAVITSGHLNHMSNGMLSMCDGSVKVFANIFEYDNQMKFDADKKKADIEEYGLTPIEKILELDGFVESDYDTYNLQYVDIMIGKDLITWEWMEALSDYCVVNGL